VGSAPGGKLCGKPGSKDQLPIPAPNGSLMLGQVNLKIVEAKERTLTGSGNSREALSQRSRRDSPDQAHQERVQRRLEPKTSLSCRAGRQGLEERAITPGVVNTSW
jgi:hypothetical protein